MTKKFDYVQSFFVAMNIIVPFALILLIVKMYEGWQNTEATIIGLCIVEICLLLGWKMK